MLRTTYTATAIIFAACFVSFSFNAVPEAKAIDKGGCVTDQETVKGLRLDKVAPDFSLKDQNGKIVNLSDFKGKKNVVVYFYPKDDTPICTRESCSFRDAYQIFQDMGAEVIGISSDSVESHKKFAEKHRLPFTLLSDEDGKLRKAWSVPRSANVMPGRVTYVINKDGVVKHVFSSQLDAQEHVDVARKVLEKLQ